MNRICARACFFLIALYALAAADALSIAQSEKVPHPSPEAKKQVKSINSTQLDWIIMVPALGKQSPVRALLHEDPVTHSSQFLIRMPPNFHVPAHFHGVNETHTVVEGTFIIQANNERIALKPGGFNYTPAQVVHEAWTPENEGALIFVTVDGPYDLFPTASEVQPSGAQAKP
jgi:quercetin dioxygenase-like cupin family protein